MDFKTYQEQLNIELDRFTRLLNVSLPRYTDLIKKQDISEAELKELGDLEYLLIEINAKIAEVKKQLDHDLFGLSLDLYYKLKHQAKCGDLKAAKKIIIMRKAFDKSLKGNEIINWN